MSATSCAIAMPPPPLHAVLTLRAAAQLLCLLFAVVLHPDGPSEAWDCLLATVGVGLCCCCPCARDPTARMYVSGKTEEVLGSILAKPDLTHKCASPATRRLSCC